MMKELRFALYLVFMAAIGFILADMLSDRNKLNHENETQKQTIERLNNQLSKMDTLHDECFKVSEIRKNK